MEMENKTINLILNIISVILALFGLALLVIGGISVSFQNTTLGFTLCLTLAGYGWGMATIGATATLHRDGHPSAFILASHDVILFIAALLGVSIFGRF